ncbi:MAG: hypothetical protein K0S65_2009, partial [Labilithrix sp.]|nr:hypothetical protein [Labilithrix sp.]
TASVAVPSVDHVEPKTETPRPTEEPVTARGADGSTTAAIPVDELPSAAPPSASAPAPAFAGGVRGASVRSSTVSAGGASSPEIELLQRAKAALVSDPERALSITSEQARAYPSGEFVQEREVIAVEALSRLGRKDEAVRRARALVKQFPRTPYAARLEIAVGQPL